MKDLYQVFLIHFSWMSLHYTSAHLYIRYCTPWGVIGAAFSPVMTMTPQCQAFRWCIVQGALSINSMWMTLGTWVIAKIAAYQMIVKTEKEAKDK